jgi:hypothetical protein
MSAHLESAIACGCRGRDTARQNHSSFHRLTRVRLVVAALVVAVGAVTTQLATLAGDPALKYDSVVVGDEGVSPLMAESSESSSTGEWIGDSIEAEVGSAVSVGEAGIRRGPLWDVAVDALMLWQGNAQSLPLLLDTSGGTALNAQNLQTEMGAGVRVGAVRAINERYVIEGNYFQARPFNATGYAPAAGGPYEQTNTGDLVFIDIQSATVTSSGWIQSTELNWRKNECWSPITWLVGFRWVELNSQANINYAFENPVPYGSGSIDTNVGNNLYGGQAGADMRLWNKGGKWRVNGLGKAGIFYNNASFQRSTAGFITDTGDVYPLGSVSATADQTSFFGEVGLNSTYWITSWLAWRAGYTVMWAAGVAVALEQFPLNNFGDGTASINTNGSVLLHGVTTGIEARW